MVTEQNLRAAIRTLGLSSLPVCLHTSFRSFGGVEGGPEAVLRAFLAEGCTVLVPAFSDDFAVDPPPGIRPKRNGWNYEEGPRNPQGAGRVYAADTNEITLPEMGILPATVLARKDRIRGNHPLCSFAAIGPLAGSIIARQTPIDVFAPLRALAEAGGWVVLIGTGLHSMTLLHAAEELAGRRPFIRWANGPGGKPIGVSMGGCSLGFEKLAPALAPLEKKWTVGRSAWRAFPAAETLETASAAIRADPEITRCADENCPRCGDQVLGGPVG